MAPNPDIEKKGRKTISYMHQWWKIVVSLRKKAIIVIPLQNISSKSVTTLVSYKDWNHEIREENIGSLKIATTRKAISNFILVKKLFVNFT